MIEARKSLHILKLLERQNGNTIVKVFSESLLCGVCGLAFGTVITMLVELSEQQILC